MRWPWAEDRGAVAALERGITIALKPIDELQKSIDYCDKVVADINVQITAMKVRIADITIAAAKGTDSGTPSTFKPIVFDPADAPKTTPTPTPTPAPVPKP